MHHMYDARQSSHSLDSAGLDLAVTGKVIDATRRTGVCGNSWSDSRQ